MRVALACPYAWDDPGGVQVQVRELAERLRDGGHEVLVLAPARTAPAEPWVRAVGRPLDIPYNASNAPIDPRPWSRAAVRHALAGVRARRRARTPADRALDRAVGHARGARAGGGHVPFGGGARAPLRPGRARPPSCDATSDDPDGCLGTGRRLRNGEDRRHVRDHPEWVGCRSLRQAPTRRPWPRQEVVVRRQTRCEEGILHGPASFPVACRTSWRIFASSSSAKARKRSAVATLAEGLRERVTMLGAVRNADLPPVATSCDLYLGPAIGGESFGVVLIEAMAAGLPVVASDIPGYDEVVTDGVDGLLVPAGRPRRARRRRRRACWTTRRSPNDWRPRAANAPPRSTGRSILPAIEDVYARALQTGPASLR